MKGSAQRGRVGQKVMVEIIDLEHRLPLRPIIVQVAGCKERIKINHTFDAHAGICGEAVKDRLIDEAQLVDLAMGSIRSWSPNCPSVRKYGT